MSNEDLTEALSALLGKGTTDVISATFRHMDIAEDEIKRAMRKHPDKTPLIWRMFKACRSPIVQPGMPDSLFRYHCRQFLRNIVQGVDPDRPTKVEAAIMVIKGCESVAPPPSDLARLFLGDAETARAFGGVFDPLPSYKGEGEIYWPELTRTCRQVYKRHGIDNKPRSEVVKDCLKRDAPDWVYEQYKTPERTLVQRPLKLAA